MRCVLLDSTAGPPAGPPPGFTTAQLSRPAGPGTQGQGTHMEPGSDPENFANFANREAWKQRWKQVLPGTY